MPSTPARSLAKLLEAKNPVAAFERLGRVAKHPSNLNEFPLDPGHDGQRTWYTPLSPGYQIECSEWPIPNVKGSVTDLKVYKTNRSPNGDYVIQDGALHISRTKIGNKSVVRVKQVDPDQVAAIEEARNKYRGPKAVEAVLRRLYPST